MLYGLKDGKEVLKMLVSDLKSAGWNFTKFGKVKKNTLYVYFLTRQGVARLIATRRPHDIKDNPELAYKLDKLQDWIFGEVLPEVMTTGRYSGRPLVAGQHAITEMPTKLSDALRLMAGDEHDMHLCNAMAEEASEELPRGWMKVSEEWCKDHNISILHGAMALLHLWNIFGLNWSSIELRDILDDALEKSKKIKIVKQR